MAKVARQIDDPHVRIVPVHFDRAVQRLVGRSVVDEHDLVRAREARRGRGRTLIKLADESRGAVQRRDDRQIHQRGYSARARALDSLAGFLRKRIFFVDDADIEQRRLDLLRIAFGALDAPLRDVMDFTLSPAARPQQKSNGRSKLSHSWRTSLSTEVPAGRPR